VFLDFKRDRVEELFLFKKHGCAVVVPEVPKVGLNPVLEFVVNVLVASKGLVLNFLNENQPLVQSVFIVGVAGRPHCHYYIDEVVHQDRKESHSQNLDD